MDFVIASGFSLSTITDLLRGASVCWRGERDFQLKRFGAIEVFASDPTDLNAPARTDLGSGAFYLFDGEFSAVDQFFHPLLKPRAAELRRRIDSLLASNDADHQINAGVFAAGRIDQNRLELVTDPLSQYPLYYFRSGDRFILSNVLRQIAAALTAFGLSATPSLLPCLESTALGGALGEATHVNEIKRLPFGHAVVADPNLKFRQRSSPARDLPYEETVKGARSALMRHIRSIAGAVAEPRLVAADVTGGSDTRLVLSFLLDSPLRSEIRALCTTRYPHPDANVAGALMTAYDLPLARIPVIVDADGHSWLQKFGRTAIEANAAFTGGCCTISNPMKVVAFSNFVHFSGRFGEIGGATPMVDFASEAEGNGYSAARAVDFTLEARKRSGALNLIREEGLAVVRRRAIDVLAALQEEGVQRGHLTAEFYLRTRCRSHFGLVNWLQNKSKIAATPLASSWLVEARRKLSPQLHHKNKVILDLLLAGPHSELALHPMANKTWDLSVVPPEQKAAFRQIVAVTRSSPPLSPLTGRLMDLTAVTSAGEQRIVSHPAVSKQRQSRDEQPRSADGGQTRFVNEVYIDPSRSMMQELLERIPSDSDIWCVFDRNEAIRYAHQPNDAFKSGVETDALGKVVSGMLWCIEQPAPPGIQELRALPPACT